MTTEEIKQNTSMRDVLAMYGIRVDRNGFCHCPLPGHARDKTASFRVYDDNFCCYGCMETGDIFTFVQKMDGCSFADAFRKLGGSYKKSTAKDMFARHRIEHEKERRRRQEEQARKEQLEKVNTLKREERLLQSQMDSGKLIHLSDEWCDVRKRLTKVSGMLDMLCGVCITMWEEKPEKRGGGEYGGYK